MRRRKIYLLMRGKADRLPPIGKTLLSYRQRHDGAIAAQQMHALIPVKNQTPPERLSCSAVPNLGPHKAKKPHADIAESLLESFEHRKGKVKQNKIHRI
jgi:hypothetical protein